MASVLLTVGPIPSATFLLIRGKESVRFHSLEKSTNETRLTRQKLAGHSCASTGFSLLRTLKEKEGANQNLGHHAVIFLRFNLVVLVNRLCDDLLIVVGRKVSLLPLSCWAI